MNNQLKRLIFLIMMLIPFLNIIGALLYFLAVKCSGLEKILVLLGFIPGLSTIIAIILIVNFAFGGKLLSPDKPSSSATK